jgi:hypothetical protein
MADDGEGFKNHIATSRHFAVSSLLMAFENPSDASNDVGRRGG